MEFGKLPTGSWFMTEGGDLCLKIQPIKPLAINISVGGDQKDADGTYVICHDSWINTVSLIDGKLCRWVKESQHVTVVRLPNKQGDQNGN